MSERQVLIAVCLLRLCNSTAAGQPDAHPRDFTRFVDMGGFPGPRTPGDDRIGQDRCRNAARFRPRPVYWTRPRALLRQRANELADAAVDAIEDLHKHFFRMAVRVLNGPSADGLGVNISEQENQRLRRPGHAVNGRTLFGAHYDDQVAGPELLGIDESRLVGAEIDAAPARHPLREF